MRVLRSERGFTAVELIIVVVILGLIAVPLSMSVTQALKLMPEANARSTSASTRFFLTDTWARDTLNTTTITTPATDGTSFGWCPLFQTSGTQPFFETNWKDGATTISVKYEAVYATPPGGGSIRRVDVRRTENGSPDIVATGYCDAYAFATSNPQVHAWDLTNQLVNGDLHRRVRLTLHLSPRPGDPIESVDFEGALGKTK